MSTALRLVTVLPTEEELAKRARRRSWWLLVARLSSGRTQADAAIAIGLTAASSYGDFERAITEPSMKQIALLAVFFDVPLQLLTDPPETDEARLEAMSGHASRRTVTDDGGQRRRATG
jgi:transcriptional regulator with XRE-family HTH domain